MILSELETRKIAIWGLGKEGMSSYEKIRGFFPQKKLILVNQSPPELFPHDEHCQFIPEDEFLSAMDEIDLVIKSPGISLYHPLCDNLREKGVEITSASNLWFATPRKAKVIAITGSNGKSTTSALTAHILNGMGRNAALGGNIGTPLLDLPDDADIYVVELSSYQTADLHHAPDIAVLLNLFPEHIQWHKSHAQYYQDKCHLIRLGADRIILNRTDPLTQQIISPPQHTVWFNDQQTIYTDDHHFYQGTKILGDVGDMSLPGKHNRENVCAALTICHALDLDLKECFTQATNFTGLPHRLEILGRRDGHDYINDSISTTPEATLAALRAYEGRQITLIMGGQNRGQDYTSLAGYIKSHPEISVITAYETGPLIDKELKGQSIPVKNLPEAVEKARNITSKDGLILLSPAAPSYGAFDNFEQRGDLFRNLVRN